MSFRVAEAPELRVEPAAGVRLIMDPVAQAPPQPAQRLRGVARAQREVVQPLVEQEQPSARYPERGGAHLPVRELAVEDERGPHGPPATQRIADAGEVLTERSAREPRNPLHAGKAAWRRQLRDVQDLGAGGQLQEPRQVGRGAVAPGGGKSQQSLRPLSHVRSGCPSRSAGPRAGALPTWPAPEDRRPSRPGWQNWKARRSGGRS